MQMQLLPTALDLRNLLKKLREGSGKMLHTYQTASIQNYFHRAAIEQTVILEFFLWGDSLNRRELSIYLRPLPKFSRRKVHLPGKFFVTLSAMAHFGRSWNH